MKDTFWYDLIPKGDLKIDSARLEMQFKAAEIKKIEKKEKKKIESMLDMKRSQNLGIFMAGFKVPMYELDEKLMTVPNAAQTNCLSMEHIMALKKLGPTPEEREAYARYKGDKAKLSEIDQFLMKLMEIENLEKKLNLQMWLTEFPIQVGELVPSIALAMKAVKELKNSKRFKKVCYSFGESEPATMSTVAFLSTLPPFFYTHREKETFTGAFRGTVGLQVYTGDRKLLQWRDRKRRAAWYDPCFFC